MRNKRLMPAGHWDWPIPVSFSQGWLVDNLLFIGGQVSANADGQIVAPGDIAAHTRNTCEFIHKVLAEGGGDWPDLFKLNTWYDFNGQGQALKDYWEQMTKVRLEYLHDPGPAGTALRIAGLGIADLVIEIAGIAAQPWERKKLERLVRYVTRPAISERRLSLTSQGLVRYELKTPFRDGTTHVFFEPLDFMARLAALIPKPRVNLVRYHGVFAPNSSYRAAVTLARHGRKTNVSPDDRTPAQRRAAMT